MTQWSERALSDGSVLFNSSENAEVRIRPYSETAVKLDTKDWVFSSKSLVELSAYLLLKAQELAAKEKA